ncbi:hypothetical protein D3C79_791660 [compost metagenome]
MVNVKKHLKIPFGHRKWIGRDDTLADMYEAEVEEKCYYEDSITNIEDKHGKEVISMRTFYIGHDVNINENDLIRCDDYDYPIKKLTKYRTKKGKLVLWVAYV